MKAKTKKVLRTPAETHDAARRRLASAIVIPLSVRWVIESRQKLREAEAKWRQRRHELAQWTKNSGLA